MVGNHLQLASQRGARLFAVTCLMAGVCCIGLLASPAQAELIQPGAPDIYSAFTKVVYDHDAIDATTGKLTADGFARTLEHPTGTVNNIAGGRFDLDAEIDASGVLTIGAGSKLKITGSVAALEYSGTLLTGNLTKVIVGSPLDETLYFLFDVTGGAAADLYAGAFGGAVLLHKTGFEGSFASSFASDGFLGYGAYSDTVKAIPEPSSVIVWCLLGGLGISVGWWRRKAST